MKEIDPFSNIADQPIEGSIYGSQISNFNSLEIGAGTKTMRVDESGLWLGADQFADAPFRVDMSGNIFASSVTLSQYVLAVGGAYSSATTGSRVLILPTANTGIVAYASNGTSVVFQVQVGGADVGDVVIGNYSGGYGALWDNSAGVFYVKGDIVAGNIDADRINTGTFSTSRIPNLNANKITTGTLDANRIGTGTLDASVIGAGTINASTINVTNLNASNIATGSMNAGRLGAGTVGGTLVFNSSNLIDLRGLSTMIIFKSSDGSTEYGRIYGQASSPSLRIGAGGNAIRFDSETEFNDNALFNVNRVVFNSRSSNASDAWAIYAYSSGGTEEIRTRVDSSNYRIDQTSV